MCHTRPAGAGRGGAAGPGTRTRPRRVEDDAAAYGRARPAPGKRWWTMLKAHPAVLRELVGRYLAMEILSREAHAPHRLARRIEDTAYTLCVLTGTRRVEDALREAALRVRGEAAPRELPAPARHSAPHRKRRTTVLAA